MSRIDKITGETNPVLSKIATGYKNASFIANKVAPGVESLTQSGTVMQYGKEGFKLYNTERALRAAAQKMDFEVDNFTYQCAEHALETSLDYKEIDEAEKYGTNKVIQLKTRALRIVQQALRTEYENNVANSLFNTDNFASGNKVGLTDTDCWDDQDNSTPVSDINTGKEAARDDIGIYPNTIVLGARSFRLLKEHPNIKDRIKNTKNTYVTGEDLKQILDFENVLVGTAVYADDDGAFTDIWGDYAALIYLPTQGEIAEGVPLHTITINETGYPEVKEYPNKKTLDIEETLKYVVKKISTSNGYLISNTEA